MSERKAVYGGSFDPPTHGHVWVIREAAALFDRVIVAIGTNPDKHPTFSVQTRAQMLSASIRDLANVEVVPFSSRFLVEFAAEQGARHLVRGVRNAADYEAERTIRHMNADIDDSVRTVLLPPPRDIAEISSSLIKGLVGNEGWERVVTRYVPSATLIQLIGKEHAWVTEALREAGGRFEDDWFWNTVLPPYLEDGRHYHDLFHIADGLNELKRMLPFIKDRAAVGLAWACHDIVYDVSRDDNEERSAEYARCMANALELPDVFRDRSARMVLSTKKHVSTDADTRILHGADLAALGTPPHKYRQHEQSVAREYLLRYTPEEFAIGRAAWAAKFLEEHPEHIYADAGFEERYGAQARRNLEESISRLRSGEPAL